MTKKISKLPESLERVLGVLLEKKVEELMVLDVESVVGYTDYFVIGTGNTSPHVQAMAEAVAMELKVPGNPVPVEGKTDGTWVLVDQGDFLVHLFQPQARRFYALEDLWSESRSVVIDEERILAEYRKHFKEKILAERASGKVRGKKVAQEEDEEESSTEE